MWPWGHLAVGYLCYVGWRRHTESSTTGFAPALATLVLLAIGTQFPDLIDKPLAWTVHVLPAGRTLAHSALVAVPIALGGIRVLDPESGAAFAIGYWSHLVADSVWPLFEGQVGSLAFLLWPVLPLPTYEIAPSFGAHFAAFTVTPQVATEFALFGLAVGHWLSVGRPGLSAALKAVRRVVTTA